MNSSKILLTLFSLIFLKSVASQTIPLWGQCANYQGSLGTCAAGSYCWRSDAWYSQCIPSPATTTAASSINCANNACPYTFIDSNQQASFCGLSGFATNFPCCCGSSQTAAPAAVIPLWGQCANNQGSLGTCASGSYCKMYDAWYSQCIPA